MSEFRSRLAQGNDVERRDRALKAREPHLADGLHVDVVLDLGVETLGDQDLAADRLVGEPRGDLPNGNVFAEGGDSPVQATSATGAVNYVTLIAPSADPPVFRIEDDPISCP